MVKKNPKVFISYSHDSPAHADRVLAFSDQLRDDGIDTILDQYNPHPPEGWPRWTDTQIRDADFVLMICTETYDKRVMGEEEPGTGLGVRWEGNLIYQYIYDTGGTNTKFIPVLLEDGKPEYIPTPCKGVTRYSPGTADGYEDLYRRLTNQPKTTKPNLGKLKAMPPRERQTDFFLPRYIPYPRNPFFTGREDILADLHGALQSSHATALSQPQAIFGLGGIGKTQTAIEYAYRHWDEYAALLWVPSDSREAIIDGLVALASLLNLPEKDEQDQSLAVSAVTRWLEGHTGWLLVFDNADNPDLIESFLPRHAQGHILLTSRAQVFDVLGIAEPLEVMKMEPPEAREFLKKRTNRSHVDGDEAKALDDLIGEFDGLPLVLEQAGAYILKMKCTFRDYLSAYKTRGLTLLKQMSPVVGKYPQSVTTTWLLNFQEVETISPASADLLRSSAFLSPDRIPFEIFISGAKELGPALSAALTNAKDDPLILNEILAPLTQFSLIHIDPQSRTYDVHRLVQAVLKDTMDESTRRIWSERIVRALNKSLPLVEFSNWPACERLVGQALACAGLIDEERFEFEEAGRVLNQTGLYLSERARYARAEPLLKRALKIWEKVLGPDHPILAFSLDNLALLYDDQGKYRDAEPLLRRAVEVLEKLPGPDHPRVATLRRHLKKLRKKI